MTANTKHVAIIGGGISGLSAAWYLQQAGIGYSVLEASPRWGGKVFTEQVEEAAGQFVVEGGPDSFLTQKPWALELARALGLDARLIGTNDKLRTIYVLHKGKPAKMPDGVMLIVPTRFMPFALSGLISPWAKLRMGMDLFIPPKRDDEDETLAQFIIRRLGHEALDKIAEPMMSGIYNADADKQSILATFPRFRQMERDNGSLIRGMLASRRAHPAPTTPGAKKTSAFMSLAGGTQELIDALVAQLQGDLRLNTEVARIAPLPGGRYCITTADGGTLEADAVLLTTPAYCAADLLRPLAPAAADKLAAIRYVSTGTLTMAFRASDLKQPLQGHGLVVPKSEHRPINAITISSTKFAQRAPNGYVLLRAFFGGSRSPETMDLDDDQLLAVVRAELKDILAIDATPLFHRIYRWRRANPQYDVGHLALVDEIEGALPAGLYITGAALRGVGMPDCVYQAQRTVKKMTEQLSAETTQPAEVIA